MDTDDHIPDSAIVTVETWDGLFRHWHDEGNQLDWNCIFTLPVWLKAWWDSFGEGLEPYICAAWKGKRLLGIAPFIRDNSSVRMMGSRDVSDYADLIVVPGKETEFLKILFLHLRHEGIGSVDAGPMRPDSSVFSQLKRSSRELGYEFSDEAAERTYELLLPHSWEDYLRILSGKERHEIQRKLRRLKDAGQTGFRIVRKKEEVEQAMDIFIRLFRSSTQEKASFMDPVKESFFHTLASSLAEARMLILSFLDIDDAPVAATLCFDYRSTVYIYNNGYNDKYARLNVGLLSKIFSIRHSIELGREKYDFLKGDEPYKARLGGTPVQLYDCRIKLS